MSKRNRRKQRAAEVRAEREAAEVDERDAVDVAEETAPHRGGAGDRSYGIEYTLSDELDEELRRGRRGQPGERAEGLADDDEDDADDEDEDGFEAGFEAGDEETDEAPDGDGFGDADAAPHAARRRGREARRAGGAEARAERDQAEAYDQLYGDGADDADDAQDEHDAAAELGYDPYDYPAVAAVDLGKDYGDVPALYPVDLEVAAGQAVALIGHNGSGKSTFLKMVAGLLEPSSGDVEVAGWEVGTAPARATTSYLPDDPVLYDDLSVREHIEYVSRLHGGDGYDEYAESLLERLGLLDRVDELPSRFSRGLRQKTSIVLGMVRPFSVLLVDEPFVGLDASGRRTMLELLAEAHRDGAAVVVATHEPEFVERVDRCVALRDGRVIFDGHATVKDVLGLVTG